MDFRRNRPHAGIEGYGALYLEVNELINRQVGENAASEIGFPNENKGKQGFDAFLH